MPEQAPFRFADLFAGIGGFHAALSHAGGECVFVSEIDPFARAVYERAWIGDSPNPPHINTDIRIAAPEDGLLDVPERIDVLTAGFPCQPFSKSGKQRGMEEARGTLFYNIARVVEERRPTLVMLENVRNLAGPQHAHEWEVIIRTLRESGYKVSSQPTVFSPHLLPPSRGGTPQTRDRAYIMATYVGRGSAEAAQDPGPVVTRRPVDGWQPDHWRAEWVLEEGPIDTRYRLTAEEHRHLAVWETFVDLYRKRRHQRLPGFPLWTDYWVEEPQLEQLAVPAMPVWKQRLVRKNVEFFQANRDLVHAWREAHDEELGSFPASRRKLEWQAGDLDSITKTAVQFRPSGIRVKAPTYLPALVAITQTPILVEHQRRLTPTETARLQGLDIRGAFGAQGDARSYRQTGNAVAVGAVWHVLREHVRRDAHLLRQRSPDLVAAVDGADENPIPELLRPEAYEAEALAAADRLV